MMVRKKVVSVLLCAALSFTASPTHAFRGYLVKKVIELSDEIARVGGRSLGKTISNPNPSKILAERLKSMGHWPKNVENGDYAAHHIIPTQLSQHRILRRIGMDMDKAANGLALPTKPGLHPTLPLHRGSHPGYTNAVKQALDRIPYFYSKGRIQRHVNEIQRTFRQDLLDGAALHRSHGAQW